MIKQNYSWGIMVAQIVALVVLLGACEYLVRQGFIKDLYLAAPSQVIKELLVLLHQEAFYKHLSATLIEFVLGYFSAVILGITLGLFMILTPKAEHFCSPFLSALMAIPKVTIIPLLTLWLGIGLTNKIAIVFIFSFFPIIFNTITGIKQTAENHLKVAQVFGATHIQIIRKVILPSAMPTIFSGMRLAAASGLVGALFGEMMASKEGLGNILIKATQLFQTAQVFAIIFIVTMISVLLIAFIDLLERKVFLKWKSS